MHYPRTSWKSLQTEPGVCLRIAKISSSGIEITGADLEEVQEFVSSRDPERIVQEDDGRVIIK